MTHRPSVILAFVCAISLFWMPELVPIGLTQGGDPVDPYFALTGPFVVRVYYDRIEEITRLTEFDVFEYNNGKAKYFLAALDAAGYRRVQELGFRVEVDTGETARFRARPAPGPQPTAGIPGFGCYRTVEETFAAAATLVTNYPGLAAWNDAGDSWQKTTNLGGYDMMVLKLTNAAIAGPKPKLFITAAIHAREYTTAELVTRFAEYLAHHYGIDADATWLLDWHEIHLMLHTNPDGRKQAETGLYWRKNTNQNYCGAASASRGADLNRNFAFGWGCCGGASGNPCDALYRGPTAASEPETQVVQDYLRAIFPDQRGPNLTDPAPSDAPGIYLDIHSYSKLVLWPWGFTNTIPPNGPALRTLGRKLAYFNGYTPQQSIGLYPTDGTTIDFAYGDLGVASYVFELGTAFFQTCEDFEGDVLPANLPALLYVAKALRTPYLTPAGPEALNVAAAPMAVASGSPVTLSATIDDTRFNNSEGFEPTQNIAAAEYYIDVPPWDVAHSPFARAMTASDGGFNSTLENVTAAVDTSGLAAGRHILFVRGQDAAGNWGPFSATFLDIVFLETAPAAAAVCAPADAVYTVTVGYPGSVTLSVGGAPQGTSVTLAPNPVAGPGSSQLIIGNSGAAAAGSYSVTITGTATAIIGVNRVRLDIMAAAPAAPALVAPANSALGVAPQPTFTWAAAPGAVGYDIDVATNPTFSNIIASARGLPGTSYTPPAALSTGRLHYWRVRATNGCGDSSYAAIYRFTTAPAPGDCGPLFLPLILASYDFEAGAAGWTHAGTGDSWALWGSTVHGGSAAFHATPSNRIGEFAFPLVAG